MTAQRPRPAAAPDHAGVLGAIADGAAAADAGTRDLSGDMALLCASGLLGLLCNSAQPPAAQVTLLRRIGRASLSVGRLAEGHMNALRLIELYATPDQQRRHRAAAANGTIYGVWGADDNPPLRLTGPVNADRRLPRPGPHAPTLRLTGGKRFASGIGVVGCALVTAQREGGTQLALVPVNGGSRSDVSGWNTTGMRATLSGSYDFDGAVAEPLGRPGDYEREPHFQGGVWRYAAVQVGGLEVLAEAVRARVASESGTEAQLHRVARIATLAHSARLLVEDAAQVIASPCAGAADVARVLAAREAVEAACLDGIAICDRALGTRSFAVGDTAERVRRDLGFFLRQADLDGKLRLVGETLCRAERPVGEIWGTL